MEGEDSSWLGRIQTDRSKTSLKGQMITCMRAFSEYCLILSFYTIDQLLLKNKLLILQMMASLKSTVIKTVNIVLCACVRLDFPFHVARSQKAAWGWCRVWS